jgi:hypothetical protein
VCGVPEGLVFLVLSGLMYRTIVKKTPCPGGVNKKKSVWNYCL